MMSWSIFLKFDGLFRDIWGSLKKNVQTKALSMYIVDSGTAKDQSDDLVQLVQLPLSSHTPIVCNHRKARNDVWPDPVFRNDKE